MEELIREIRDDVKTLLVSDGRKHERIKSLESTRKWVGVIFGSVVTALLIGFFVQ